ncbi:ABC transporter ATP-binding protein [uncultured Amnibacterium sp.]|uniref:ABC transporter ATP-binding protein n=1 Tax=uncultured Amnibacterium sp. TaxID=1631851 RepID=UPI0035CBF342
MTAVLHTQGLSVRYGGVKALTDCDVSVEEGTLVGLIGPNGAGKTTFIDAVTGFTRSTGSVVLDGTDISRLSPHRRARAGFARTWQAAELFDELTVRENVGIGARSGGFRSAVAEIARGHASLPDEVDETLELLGLADLADAMPDTLTHGQRKVVGVGRALAGRPRVVLLDEPAAGLDSTESAELGERLRGLVDRGTALLLVDHDMGLVLSMCDVVVVLEFGKVISSGSPEEIRNDARVIEAYLGSLHEAAG